LFLACLKPLGGGSDYRLPFEFTAGVKALPEKNQLTVNVSGEPASAFDAEKDFRPLSFTANDAFAPRQLDQDRGHDSIVATGTSRNNRTDPIPRVSLATIPPDAQSPHH